MSAPRPALDPRTAFAQLLGLELGDILTIPDGRQVTVRAIEMALATPVGSMTGFILGGELGPQSVLVSVPASPDSPIGLYAPLDAVPAHAKDAQVVCEGVVSYWAPHLPNAAKAMGELGYKVCRVRGSIDPMVLVWRGRERVVFIRSAVASATDFAALSMSRDRSANEVGRDREAARVSDSYTSDPDTAYAPARTVRERIRELVGR